MSRYSDAQRRRVRAAVFVAGLFGYAALAALVFPLDGSSDAFGRTLGIGVLGLVVLMASVAGITAWRVRAPGVFNASSSTLLWVGLSSGVVVAAALPDLYASAGLTGAFVTPLRVVLVVVVVPIAAAATAHWTADAASSDVIITD